MTPKNRRLRYFVRQLCGLVYDLLEEEQRDDTQRVTKNNHKTTLPLWEGKRVLITWKDSVEADWLSFIVEKETEDGLLLRGCKSPDGSNHDGSSCFAKHEEIKDIQEWVSET